MWRATNPMLFTGFDEQLHMRTLSDIASSHRIFEPHPLLMVSPRYPGIETIAVLVHQTGIPTMASAFIVIIAARIVGKPSSEIESILGYIDEPELIHRTNLVLID